MWFFKVYSARTSWLTSKLSESYSVDNFWFPDTPGTPESDSPVEILILNTFCLKQNSVLYNRNDYTMVALENLVLILIRQELKLTQIIYRSDFNTMAWNHTVWDKIYYMKKISWLNWQWPNHYVLRGLKIFLSSHMRKIYIITTEIMSGFQKYLHTNSLLL